MASGAPDSAFEIIQRQRALKGPESDGDSKRAQKPCVVKSYFKKYRGSQEGLFPPKPTVRILVWSFIASFTGISICAALTYNVNIRPGGEIGGEPIELGFIIGSFGATAVLIYGAVDSPFSQPRNVLVGNFLSGIIGIAIAEMFAALGLQFSGKRTLLWMECALAVSLSIFAMQAFRCVHPPGGATAMIAVTSTSSERMHGLFILPVFGGLVLMLLVALLINNIARQYPTYWWKPTIKDIPIREGSTHHLSRAFGEAFNVAELQPRPPQVSAQVVLGDAVENGTMQLSIPSLQNEASTLTPSAELSQALERARCKIAALETELQALRQCTMYGGGLQF